MPKLHYEERVDRIFTSGMADLWEHRTLRTIFDPLSNEWSETEMEEKLQIVETITSSGENLNILILEYKDRYLAQGRKDIAEAVVMGLAEMLEFSVKVSKKI